MNMYDDMIVSFFLMCGTEVVHRTPPANAWWNRARDKYRDEPPAPWADMVENGFLLRSSNEQDTSVYTLTQKALDRLTLLQCNIGGSEGEVAGDGDEHERN